MKLYVDGLFYKGSGIGRYYESVTKELAERGVEIYTGVPKCFKKDWYKNFKEYENVFPIFLSYKKFSINAFLKQSLILRELEKNGIDLFFFPHINLPYYIPRNTVITIHDLRPFTSYWDRGRITKWVFKKLLVRAINKSKKIIAISDFTKKNLINLFGNRIEPKLRVIYRFIDDKFFEFQTSNNIPIVKDSYILFIGNRKRHKNLENLVIAFSRIKQKINCKLVIAGTKDTCNTEDNIDRLIKKLRLENFVIQILSPSDKDIFNLYKNAKLFVFPSLYEGFGLPPLEAIACGCPVITSNIPVLQEIYGEEIACFNPNSVRDIAEKICNVLLNYENRVKLLERGAKILKKFETRKIIDEHLSLFKEVIEL